MRHWPMFVAALVLAAPLCLALENGDFEEVEDGKLAGWDVRAVNATVTPERIRGKWRHFVCDVKPGRFDKIHLVLSFQAAGVGSIWFDHFTSDGLKIVNPDFEDVNAGGRLVGWQQDNAGETIFSDTDKVTHGKRSLRLTRKGGIAPTRVWQVIDVEKNKDDRLEFDCFLSDDFDGNPNVATLTYESDGKYYGSPMWIRTASWTDILNERTGESDWIALMKLDGGMAELSQVVTLPAPGNAELAASVRTTGLAGMFRMVVEDADGAVLGETRETAATAKWHTFKVAFRNETGQARVRLVSEGTGEVRIDSATLGASVLLPPVQDVAWGSADRNFALSDKVTFRVDRAGGDADADAPDIGGPGGPVEGALTILGHDLDALGLDLEKTSSGDAHIVAQDAHITARIAPDGGVPDKGGESYTLDVDESGVRISASTDVGVLRAAATLAQLLRKYPGADNAQVVACQIKDWPDMPLRGAFWAHGFTWEQFARSKLNLMYLSTSYWLEWHAHPKEAGRLEGYFREANDFGVKILASTGVFQGYEVYRHHDPNLAEGKYVEEKLCLKGGAPVPLSHALVLRTKLRGLELASADGKTVYKEGADYVVERGTPVTYPFSKIKDPKPDRVRRLSAGAIPDGATVLARYNHGSPTGKMEICLSEPDATRLAAEALAATFKEFPQLRLFNVNLDEIAYFRLCNLCRASAKTNDQLLCDWINAMDRAIKAVRRDAQLVTWDDMLCPHVDADRIGIKDPAKLLPKDMLMLSWGYNADFPQRHGWPAVRYWSEHGLETLVVPWDNKGNIRAWARVVAEARQRGWPCLGMLASFWHNRKDYHEAAICSWRIPRKGEPRYVPLDTKVK